MQLGPQAIASLPAPSSATLQARPIPLAALPIASPASVLDTPGPGAKLEPGVHEATPLPELQGVLMGQPLSGPFMFPSLGAGTEQQHTPFLFSAQRAYASAWPGISPLPDSEPPRPALLRAQLPSPTKPKRMKLAGSACQSAEWRSCLAPWPLTRPLSITLCSCRHSSCLGRPGGGRLAA